jgi:hypothetical protein
VTDEVTIGGVRKKLVTLEELNEQYGLYEPRGGGSVWICRDGATPLQDSDLRRRLSNCVVLAYHREKDGSPEYVSAFQFFTGHVARRTYRKLAFTNKPVAEDVINLYAGLGVSSAEGCCRRIISHIEEVICAGHKRLAAILLDLFAWQLQHIGEPSRVIIVLKTKNQQAGKGIIGELLASIYGPSGFVAATTDQVLGRFNDALRGRAFVFLDEALFGGDLKAADAIKQRSTASFIGVETKGLPVVQCPIAVNFLIASNHDSAAHLEDGDARHWVFEVSEHRIGDHAYFRGLVGEIEMGGREAFAHHLLTRDVSRFVPARDVPRANEARAKLIAASFNPFDARNWLMECGQTGRLVGRRATRDSLEWTVWAKGDEYTFADLRAAYVAWQITVRSAIPARPTPVGGLGEVIARAGIFQRWGHSGRKYTLPSPGALLECLAMGLNGEDKISAGDLPEIEQIVAERDWHAEAQSKLMDGAPLTPDDQEILDAYAAHATPRSVN